jgi:hypothetical protein
MTNPTQLLAADHAARAAEHAARAEHLLRKAERQFFPGNFNATAAMGHATLALYYRDLDRAQGGSS